MRNILIPLMKDIFNPNVTQSLCAASLDAAKKIVQAEMEKTHIASVSGLKSAEICRHAFEEDLKQEHRRVSIKGVLIFQKWKSSLEMKESFRFLSQRIRRMCRSSRLPVG